MCVWEWRGGCEDGGGKEGEERTTGQQKNKKVNINVVCVCGCKKLHTVTSRHTKVALSSHKGRLQHHKRKRQEKKVLCFACKKPRF